MGHVSPTPRLNEAEEMGEYWPSVLEKFWMFWERSGGTQL